MLSSEAVLGIARAAIAHWYFDIKYGNYCMRLSTQAMLLLDFDDALQPLGQAKLCRQCRQQALGAQQFTVYMVSFYTFLSTFNSLAGCAERQHQLSSAY